MVGLALAPPKLAVIAVPKGGAGGPASQGPRSAGQGQNIQEGGEKDWNTPNLIVADDGSYTTCVFDPATPEQFSQLLRADNFGFTIPGGATIDGIIVEIQRKVDSGDVQDLEVFLVKGGTRHGVNKAAGGSWPTSDAYATYGGAADLWGGTWAATDTNATTFGVELRVTNFIGGETAFVDHVRITVHYHT